MADATRPDQGADDTRLSNDGDQQRGEGAASSFKDLGKRASDRVGTVASEAEAAVSDAVETGRAYAKDAVNAAGKKIDGAKSQLAKSCDDLTRAIYDEPVKAVVITAVVSSLLTALLMSALRSDDRYY